mmetsp:Transcript_48425/g.122160  ORF Transcript_48425/g.122160 Transcript_48425/m.122160 type:complete len:392 (+) Transcript_48425:64-1239(+)
MWLRLPACAWAAVALALAASAAPAAAAAIAASAMASGEVVKRPSSSALGGMQAALLPEMAGQPAPQLPMHQGLPELVLKQPPQQRAGTRGLPQLVLQQPTKQHTHPPSVAALAAMIVLSGGASVAVAIRAGAAEGTAAAAFAVGLERPLDFLGQHSEVRLGLSCFLAMALLDWVAFRSLHGGHDTGDGPPHGGYCSFLAWYLIIVPPLVVLTVTSQVLSALRVGACRTERVPMGRMLYRSSIGNSMSNTSCSISGSIDGSPAATSSWALFATLPQPPPHNRNPEPVAPLLGRWLPCCRVAQPSAPPPSPLAAALGAELLLLTVTGALASFGGCGCEAGLRWSVAAFSCAALATLLTVASWSSNTSGMSDDRFAIEVWSPLSAASKWQPWVI